MSILAEYHKQAIATCTSAASHRWSAIPNVNAVNQRRRAVLARLRLIVLRANALAPNAAAWTAPMVATPATPMGTVNRVWIHTR